MSLAEKEARRKILPLLAILALEFTAGATRADEHATVARDSDLRSKPLSDATVVAPLPASTDVVVISRSGMWANVGTADGKKGYVRLLNLRTAGTEKGDAGVAALVNTFKTGSSGRSVATGVKGMSDEELTGSTPSPEQVEKLGKFAATVPDARKGAATAGLAAKTVAYLPPPIPGAGE